MFAPARMQICNDGFCPSSLVPSLPLIAKFTRAAAPAPAPPRAARSWPGGASGDLQSAASAPAGGAPSWANRTNKTRSWSDPKSPVLNASGGAGRCTASGGVCAPTVRAHLGSPVAKDSPAAVLSNLPPPPPGSPRGKSGSAGDARTARLEMFLTATEAAREKHDADRDLCQEAIAALKAAAGADATAKKSPEDSALRLKTAVLYARADHLLIMATTDTSGEQSPAASRSTSFMAALIDLFGPSGECAYGCQARWRSRLRSRWSASTRS